MIVVLILGLAATIGPAQVEDGDLILTLQTPSLTLALDPTTGVWSTLAVASSNQAHNYVRMAANNTDLVVCANGAIYRLSPSGQLATAAAAAVINPRGIALDHDGTWIFPSYMGTRSSFWAMDDATGALSTLYLVSPGDRDTEMAIDRDPAAPPYVIAAYSDRLMASDRTGRLGTIASIPFWMIHGVELDPASGDYLTLGLGAPSVGLVSKTGMVRTLSHSIPQPSAARFAQDGTAWVTGNGQPPTMFRIDMQGVIITIVPIAGAATSQRVVGVDVYGSRRLVCQGTGLPGTSVRVRLQSRRPGDGAKAYLLACSLQRRPSLPLPNGEVLNLAPDALFFVSALGYAPAIFDAFQGVTDGLGNATARVHIPAGLPPNLQVTVFVAGVIVGPTGLRTVTNTHWFVLS
jgi:hypothetical protein